MSGLLIGIDMTPLVVSNLIVAGLATFGGSVFVIIGSVLTIGIAYLVFKKGWSLFYDKSLMIGGFYVRNVPYKGYNRWRSKQWNINNTM